MTAPPFVQSVGRQVVSTGLTLGLNSYVGAAVGAGQLVATVPGTGANYFVQWPSYYNMASFRQIPLPDASTRANSVCYDPFNECFYGGVFIGTNGVPHKTVTIYKLTLDGVVTRLSNAIDIGSNPPTQIAYSQITTDGASIYVALAGSSGNNSILVKLSCVDGSLTSSLSVGATPSTTSSLSNLIGLISPTALIVGGSITGNATPWFALIPTALGSVTNIIDTSLGVGVSNQVAVVGGNLWVPTRTVGTSILKVASDLSSVLTYPQGSPPESCSGLSYDGSALWALANGGDIIGFDPSSGSVTALHPELATSTVGDLGLFVAAVPGGFAALTSAGLAMFLPTGDTAEKPPILGRGAC